MRFRPDIPFRADDASRFLPWIVALMVLLSTLLMLGGWSIGSWVMAQHAEVQGRFTVQIPAQAENAPELTDRVVALLKRNSKIARIKVLDKEDMQEMLAPWLGDADALEALPMPTLIEAHMHSNILFEHDLAKLPEQLQEMHRDIEVDAQSEWVERFAAMSAMIGRMAFVLAGLLMAALVAMIIFVSRTSLKLHHRTVTMLHAVGADDAYIARQFQYNALGLAWRGTVPGVAAGALMFTLAGWYFRSLESVMVPDFSWSMIHLILLALLLGACLLMALLAARVSVLRQLERML